MDTSGDPVFNTKSKYSIRIYEGLLLLQNSFVAAREQEDAPAGFVEIMGIKKVLISRCIYCRLLPCHSDLKGPGRCSLPLLDTTGGTDTQCQGATHAISGTAFW